MPAVLDVSKRIPLFTGAGVPVFTKGSLVLDVSPT
jgi:hypothetical protein